MAFSAVWNGSEWDKLRHMHVRNPADDGWEEIDTAWQWVSGGWYPLYIRHVRVLETDNFNRPDGDPGPDWYFNGGIQIYQNAVRMVPNSSNGDYYAWAIRTNRIANADRTFVEATLADTGSTTRGDIDILPSWIILAANSTGTTSVFLHWESSTLSLWTKVNGSDTKVHNGVTIAQATGKAFRLERGSAVTGPNVFHAYVDDVPQFSWVDSAGIIPIGAPHRYAGFGLTFNRGFFDDDYSPRLDNFACGDQDY